MKLLRVVGFLSAVLLSGCAVTATPLIAPDGKEALEISCPGTARSTADCLRKAGEVCGSRGYDVLGSESLMAPYAYGSGYANQSAAGVTVTQGMGVGRTMLVRCRE